MKNVTGRAEFVEGFTTESVAATLKAKHNATIGVYAHLLAAEEAAHRSWRLAFSAREAYKAGSSLESALALRSVDCATDQLSDRVERALIGINAELAMPEPMEGDYERLFGKAAA